MEKSMTSLNDDSIKLQVIKMRSGDSSYSTIAESLGLSTSAVRRFLCKETYTEWWNNLQKPIADGTLYDHHHNIKVLNNKRYIITSAQNSTFVHDKFLASLETMAKHIDAKIIVGTYSYNLSGFQNLEKSEGSWFDPKIVDYIIDEPVMLADKLLYCGELNILPTAVRPLSGFHSYTKENSGIIPHAKVQMESLPVSKGQAQKFLYTTGSVTQRNYIQKKAGQKASFHHIFGALLVEVDDDGDWFVRQLVADTVTGEFYDLTTKYTPSGVVENCNVTGINWGDLHVEKRDDDVYRASFMSEDSMLDVLKPKYQFAHDTLDMTYRNHHNIKDPYFMYNMFVNGTEYVEEGVKDVASLLILMDRPFCQTVVVESNHDLALTRWLKTADYKTDPVNALFFLKCQYKIYQEMHNKNKDFSIFEYVVTEEMEKQHKVSSKPIFLRTDESFKICGNDGIECGAHGDLGVNGARGSIKAYQMMGTRSNIGHSHSAGIYDGVYQSGVSGKLDMEYNKGPSTWSNSHIVTYNNGKRTIVTIKNGKWRA
jgi:hypothetical protein